jgi:hypothetical protein
MRPRPLDEMFSPKTLLYSTGRAAEKPEYSRDELTKGNDIQPERIHPESSR